MASFDLSETVASITVRAPAAARTFERFGIDFCCRGGMSLAQACAAQHIAAHEVLADLASELATEKASAVPPSSPSALIGYIVERHHRFTRDELARLLPLARKVMSVHGTRHSELKEVRGALTVLADELLTHQLKEERVLFPYVQDLERGVADIPPFRTLLNPLRSLSSEHEEVGALLDQLRRLTADFTPPVDACASYRALYAGLAQLTADLHVHVHLENNVLFPLARAMEQKVRTR